MIWFVNNAENKNKKRGILCVPSAKRRKMRKLFTILVFALFMASNAHAGLITYTTLSSDAGISYGHLNTSYSTIYDEFNGSIGTANIENDSLTEPDFADAVNPRVRDNEQIGSFTYTGMLPVTDATLTSDIGAGTSYVEGYRIVTTATSKTYTASKDTYVYIDINGTFQYQEVANGAAQPSDPSNSLLLAKVVTDADNITGVTDLRTTTPPNLRVYDDYIMGGTLSRDITDLDAITISRGEIEFGIDVTDGKRRNTTPISINFGVNGRGGLDTGSLASGFYYIFGVADDDNSSNWEGIASLSNTDATGVTGERLIGWCWALSGSQISADAVGSYKGTGSSAPNIASIVENASIATTNNSYEDCGGMTLKFVGSGRPCRITFKAAFDSAQNDVLVYAQITMNGIALPATEVKASIGTGGTGGMFTTEWVGGLEGEYTVAGQWHTSGGNALNCTYRRLTVEEL